MASLRVIVVISLFAIPSLVHSETLTSEQRKAISASVALFDSLKACMGSGDFEQFGFGSGGPCAEWVKEFEEVNGAEDGRVILRAGYECFAVEARNYGTTFYRPNPDLVWREMLSGYFEACREALR